MQCMLTPSQGQQPTFTIFFKYPMLAWGEFKFCFWCNCIEDSKNYHWWADLRRSTVYARQGADRSKVVRRNSLTPRTEW